jgi:DNA-binding CsgD family transcriptional regulator
MEIKAHYLAALNRIEDQIIKYLKIGQLSKAKQLERLERLAANQPFGIVIHLFGQKRQVFISKSFFALVLPRARAGAELPAEAVKAFLLALDKGENCNALGKYLLHFMLHPHTDLLIPDSFCITGPAGTICLVSCSRALSFIGKNPDVILTLYGTPELFSTQAALSTLTADKWLEMEMKLTPRQYRVHEYVQQSLSTFSISELMPCDMATVRSYKRAIRAEIIAAGLTGVQKV